VSVEIAPRSATDTDDLFRIYARIFGDQAAAANRFRRAWQYEDNPQSPQGPVIWVARADTHPLGQIATMPVSLWWGDREVRAAWAIDYFVAPDAEGRGYGVALAKAWMDGVDVALALGLSPASYLICKRLGFRDLGEVPFFRAVLDPGAIVRRRWGGLAGRTAAPLLTAAWRLLRPRVRLSRDIDVQPAGRIGAEYDALWERARTGFVACVRRDAAYVHWKYRCAPHVRHDILEARRGGELTGFVVSRYDDYRGLRIGWIVDLFAPPADRLTRNALLASVMSAFSQAGVARAQVFCTSAALAADLRRHGFFKGKSAARLCARPNGVSDLPTLRSGDWHIVFGDSDSNR
jgi:GNAT superfamily N-acetyltransferase